jgi:hypothetical protein
VLIRFLPARAAGIGVTVLIGWLVYAGILGYSGVVATGSRLVFVAGQVAEDRQGNLRFVSAWYPMRNTAAPTTATTTLYTFNPVTPGMPNAWNSQPPTTARAQCSIFTYVS